ncbi:MAG: pyrroline-5-carboxylate reductase [Halanaerobiaceae bacterium]
MKLAIIGLGNMGTALLEGIIDSGILRVEDIIGCDIKVNNKEKNPEYRDIRTIKNNKFGVKKADVVLLAVKPQVIDQVLDDIRGVLDGKLLISIAAGISLSHLKRNIPPSVRTVRVMPNTPALIGKGISAFCCDPDLEAGEKEFVGNLLAGAGEVVEIEEELMDAVTGLSGSGPAFVYIIIEALADAGVLNGLNREDALKLAAATVEGTAAMVRESGLHPAELKDMVTSPGGTTINGVRSLEEAGLRSALIEAVKTAADRSRELGD